MIVPFVPTPRRVPAPRVDGPRVAAALPAGRFLASGLLDGTAEAPLERLLDWLERRA